MQFKIILNHKSFYLFSVFILSLDVFRLAAAIFILFSAICSFVCAIFLSVCVLCSHLNVKCDFTAMRAVLYFHFSRPSYITWRYRSGYYVHMRAHWLRSTISIWSRLGVYGNFIAAKYLYPRGRCGAWDCMNANAISQRACSRSR